MSCWRSGCFCRFAILCLCEVKVLYEDCGNGVWMKVLLSFPLLKFTLYMHVSSEKVERVCARNQGF